MVSVDGYFTKNANSYIPAARTIEVLYIVWLLEITISLPQKWLSGIITIPARKSNLKGLNFLKKLSNDAKLEFSGGWHCVPTRIPLWGRLVTSLATW